MKKKDNIKLANEVVPVPIITVKSPKKSIITANSKNTKPTPIKTIDQSESDMSSAEREQFLMLEIKQLKRQNNFLKKKISQLTIEYGPQRAKSKRANTKEKGSPKPILEFLPLSINIFFEQIHNMLNTLVKLFKINFTEQEVQAYMEKSNQQIAESCPIKKHILLKKFYMKRKLDRMMLEEGDSKFTMFLDLFTEYYQTKQESEKQIISTVDKMTLKAHQLNQWIIEKAQETKKTKTTLSTIKLEDDIPLQTLKLPSPRNNLVMNSKQLTYSPSTKRVLPSRVNKFNMSPG